MMTKEQAVRIASEYIQKFEQPEADELVLLLDRIIEKPYGWVFFYNSKLYLKTLEIRYALAGNSPFLVSNSNGEITEFGTHKPIEELLIEFENENTPI